MLVASPKQTSRYPMSLRRHALGGEGVQVQDRCSFAVDDESRWNEVGAFRRTADHAHERVI